MRETFLPRDSDPEWLAILRAECARTSIVAVSEKLGYARSSLSLVLTDRYAGSPHKVAEAVMRVLVGRVTCPHLGTDIAAGECRDHAARPMPQSKPAALRHWHACRACPLNPMTGGNTDAAA